MRRTMVRLGKHYVRILRALAEQPHQRIGEIALTEGELPRLGSPQRVRDRPCDFASSPLELLRKHVLANPRVNGR